MLAAGLSMSWEQAREYAAVPAVHTCAMRRYTWKGVKPMPQPANERDPSSQVSC